MTTFGSVFSDHEHAVLLAVAEAALPAGNLFPAADATTVRRVEQFFATQPRGVAVGYRALLRVIDGFAWVSRHSSFAGLPAADRLALLEQWRGGGLVRRNALRVLTVPLKVAHFDDPRFYRHIGCVFDRERPAPAPQPAWFRDRVHAAAALPGNASLDCDVVVVGTGAGGAVAAKELAEAGVAVVMALRAGAELYTGFRATRILVEAGRAAGVCALSADGRTLTVRARAVVIACGTLLTPALLLRNQLGGASGQLGRNLSIHPAVGCLGEMAERVAGWNGVPQGYSIDEFAHEGILMEGRGAAARVRSGGDEPSGPAPDRAGRDL